MKKLIMIMVLFVSTGVISETQARTRNIEVNFGYFYHSLQPHGEWIEVDYDVFVWRPYNTTRNWSPYSVGHWEYTSYGWYWESYEPFGWATYHYGRWYYDDYYGWVWVPGYEWGPSWVEWRYSDAYIGWSPLPPYAEFRINVGIHFTFGYVTPYHRWHFVSYNNFCRPYVHSHFVGHVYKQRIFQHTKYRTNYHVRGGRVINGGIDRNYVERRGGVSIREREVRRTSELRDYTNTRDTRGRIVSYRPAEREVNRFRDTEVRDAKKGGNRASLKKDMVTFRDREREVRRSNEREENTLRPERKREEYKTDRIETRPSEPGVISRPPVSVPKTAPRPAVRPETSPSKTEHKTYRRPVRKESKSVPSYRSTNSTRENKSYERPKRSSSKETTSYRKSSSNSSRNSAVKRSTSSQREKSSSSGRKNSSRNKKRDR